MSHLTPTVVALMDGIDQDKAYDRLPVLADALEDAGFTDEEVLGALRSNDPALRGPWYRRAVIGVSIDMIRQAVGDITRIAHDLLEFDYESNHPSYPQYNPSIPSKEDGPVVWILGVCRNYQTNHDYYRFDTSTGYMPDEEAIKIWKAYAVLTGEDTDTDNNDEYWPAFPFTCSC